LEYCPGGDLREFLRAIERFEETEVVLYFAEMIMAVHALHEMGYIHRDLKPDNFLIDKKRHIKLADFGLAKHKFAVGKVKAPKIIEAFPRPKSPERTRKTSADEIVKTVSESPSRRRDKSSQRYFTVNPMDSQPVKIDCTVISPRGEQRQACFLNPKVQPIQITKSELRKELGHSIVGSAEFMSPEVISGRHEGGSYYGTDCDWWSLGCVFFEMIFGSPPFTGNTPEELFQEVAQWQDRLPKLFEEHQDHISPNCYSLLTGFLCEPKERLGPDLKKIQAHPFFAHVDWHKLHRMSPPFVPTTFSEMEFF